MISKQPHHSVVNLFRFAQQQLKRESKSRKRTKLKVLINAAKKREPIHLMTKSAMIMEGGFEIKSELFPKTILPLFQVLSYLIACPSRRFRKTKNIMFHYLWKVSSVLWNSSPTAAPTGNTFNLFSGLLHVPGHWRSRWLQRFRIQYGLRSPSKLRCGCFRLWNSICDLIYWTSKLVESPRIV